MIVPAFQGKEKLGCKLQLGESRQREKKEEYAVHGASIAWDEFTGLGGAGV